MRDVVAVKNEQDLRFSIVTVCFNAENCICPTMNSVLKQNYKNFEYLIVDGASTDGTLDKIREYAGKDARIQWISEKDSGVFNAMNKGIHMARGDFLLFLNAGDEFHSEDILEKAAAAATEADILVGDVAFKNESGLKKHVYSVGEELVKNLRRGESVCHQVIFASRDSLVDGFDEHFTTCADYDWICRQVKAGKVFKKLDAVVVDYDVSGITFQTRYQKNHWKEYFEVIGRYFPLPDFPYGKEVKQLFVQRQKEHFMYEFMNRWLSLKQKGVCLSAFFVPKKIGIIAVYGVHHMGQRLYDELQGSEVTVKYAIDRNTHVPGGEIPILRPDDVLEKVDAVVITPVFDFLEIRDELSNKLSCPMFSMEEILFYEYDKA